MYYWVEEGYLALGATPRRRALRLVAVSGVMRLVRSVAPPLPATRGVPGTPGLIYALAQNDSPDHFAPQYALTLILRVRSPSSP